MALGHLGHGKEVTSVTDSSEEAAACRRFYDNALEEVLRAFPWPFATKIEALGLIEEDPNDEWAYSYQVPSDCLAMRRILSGVRQDTRDTRVPYRHVYGTTGGLIYTDTEDAELEYTARVTDPSRFAPDFAQALAAKLAVYIAPRVATDDPTKRQEAAQIYNALIADARSTALNEEQADVESDSEFVRTRA